ncbi:MAG TPA: NCS2 family permease [Candidatus Omnitrophota bacterium]|nr:NCS2 family permease [Candidatus Omnitrophota bacterium]HRY85891.1 NCS2 family permease [Candidatus Omnitrophota bacterium]
MLAFLDRWFKFTERKTNLHTEIIAGVTTFLAMAYIIFVNPNILSATGMDKTALITVTCLVTALTTLMTGLFANAPIAMAPGMGLNAFFAYSLVLTDKISWQTALGIVFISGFCFFILTLAGMRRKLVQAIPRSLISAMSVGIGLFITFIGLVNLGIIQRSEATLISAAPVTSTALIGLAGFLVMITLEMKKVKGAMILGILTSTLIALLMGKIAWPEAWLSFEMSFSPIAFKLDILGALKWSFMGSIFALMFMDLFDSIGSLVACCHQAKFTDEKGNIRGLDRLLSLDAIATMIGAIFGTSTTTTYVESATGIGEGGRTGLTSIVTATLFLLGMLFIPVIAIVPAYATAPALILVGFFMMKEVKEINFSNMEEGFPAFVIVVMIALSYSIAAGLAFGFLSFVVFKVVRLKLREIQPAMWVIAGLSLLHFLL